MTKTKSHFTLVAILVAVTMVVAGSVAIASNTGFKANKAMQAAGAGQIGNTWLSIPFFNPYGNIGTFCAQTGLVSAGLTRASVTFFDPGTGVATVVTCGTGAALAQPIVPGLGIRVRNAGTVALPPPANIIIVGSHNPSLSIVVPDTSVPAPAIGNYLFSVPYHTTAVSANDLCLQSGLTSTGLNRAQIFRLNPVLGTFTQVSCGTAAAGSLNLVLGEAVRLRDPNGPITFIPAHF